MVTCFIVTTNEMEYRKQLRIDGIRTERLVVKKKLRDKSGCCVWLITQKTIHVKNNRRVREELQMLHSEHYRLQKKVVFVGKKGYPYDR